MESKSVVEYFLNSKKVSSILFNVYFMMSFFLLKVYY